MILLCCVDFLVYLDSQEKLDLISVCVLPTVLKLLISLSWDEITTFTASVALLVKQ